MTAPWWAGLPPAASQVSCGTGQHVLRWADGQLTAADHADAEGELVLAALGGAKSECVALVEAWGAHAADLDVLALGPRSPADQLAVTWDLVRSLRSAISPQPGLPPGAAQRHGRLPSGRLRPRSLPMRQVSPELRRAQDRRAELMGLFALGRGFQLALAGTVAAAWSAPGPGTGPGHSPARADRGAGRPGPGRRGLAGHRPRRRCTPYCTRVRAGAPPSWPRARSAPHSRCAGWPRSGRPVSRSSMTIWSLTCLPLPGRGCRCSRCARPRRGAGCPEHPL